jgi:hypothetical protein
MPMADVRVLSWDHRDQPDLAELARLVTEMTTPRCTLHAAEATTGSDQFALVFSTQPIDEHGAYEAYEEWRASEDGHG